MASSNRRCEDETFLALNEKGEQNHQQAEGPFGSRRARVACKENSLTEEHQATENISWPALGSLVIGTRGA